MTEFVWPPPDDALDAATLDAPVEAHVLRPRRRREPTRPGSGGAPQVPGRCASFAWPPPEEELAGAVWIDERTPSTDHAWRRRVAGLLARAATGRGLSVSVTRVSELLRRTGNVVPAHPARRAILIAAGLTLMLAIGGGLWQLGQMRHAAPGPPRLSVTGRTPATEVPSSPERFATSDARADAGEGHAAREAPRVDAPLTRAQPSRATPSTERLPDVASEPGLPETAEPVTAEPVMAEPVMADPKTADPETADPETTEPVTGLSSARAIGIRGATESPRALATRDGTGLASPPTRLRPLPVRSDAAIRSTGSRLPLTRTIGRRAEGAAHGRRPTRTVADNRAAIRELVDRYRDAFNRLDAAAAAAVWPSVDVEALTEAFDDLRTQDVTFADCAVRIGGNQGERATASCHGALSYVGRVGSSDPQVERREWTFHLERHDGGWRIAQVLAR